MYRAPMTRLAPGDQAPLFTTTAVIPHGQGFVQEEFSLAQALSQTNTGVIVYFYPAAMTPGCTTQACDFRDSIASLTAQGYALVGISPDSPDKLERFAQRDALSFPLASDTDHAIAESFGAWGTRKLYGKEVVGIIRSTLVIAPGGTVAVAHYNVKATGHVARLRKELNINSLEQ